MNRAIAYIPLAFVAGGLVGAWGPNEELRAVREKSAAEKTAAAEKRPGGFDSFAKMVNIPDAAKRPRRRRAERGPEEAPAGTNAAPESADSATNAAPGKGAAGRGRLPRRTEQPVPGDLQARIDEAAELWRTRVEIARAKAVEKFGLDEAGAAKFDAAVDSMNAKLRDSAQAMADILAEEEEMTPELGVKLMGELCTALAEAYDEIGLCVGEDRRGDVAVMELHNFIDPSVAEPLISVQGKLDGGMRSFGPED